MAKKSVLMLKALRMSECGKFGVAHGGFKWPLKIGATVIAPDWAPTEACGNGLHGWLWGCGDAGLKPGGNNLVWIVAKIVDYVDLNGKVKFERCKITCYGDIAKCSAHLRENSGGLSANQVYATLTGGDRSTLTGGYRSTLTGGNYSTLTGGNYSTLTGGYRSTLTGGDRSTLTGGYDSTLTGGDRSTLTGGYRSTLTWKVYDGRYSRLTTVYVGENGIKPNTAYTLKNGIVVEK